MLHGPEAPPPLEGVTYLRADSPPLLMMQGDQDPTIPVHHARYMKERGDAVKAPVEVFIVENSGHNWREAGGALRPSLDEIMTKTAAFMKQQLDRISNSTTRFKKLINSCNTPIAAPVLKSSAKKPKNFSLRIERVSFAEKSETLGTRVKND